MGNCKSASGQLLNSGQLLSNSVNGIMLITINRVITVKTVSFKQKKRAYISLTCYTGSDDRRLEITTSIIEKGLDSSHYTKSGKAEEVSMDFCHFADSKFYSKHWETLVAFIPLKKLLRRQGKATVITSGLKT